MMAFNKRRFGISAAVASVAIVALAACGSSTSAEDGSASSSSNSPAQEQTAGTAGSSSSDSGNSSKALETVASRKLTIIVPSNPGGGWDQTARSIQHALSEAGLAKNVTVTNVPGGTGTVALAKFEGMKGNNDTLMISGLAMIGGIVTTGSKVGFEVTTPIAKLTADYELIVVPADSPYKTLSDLLDAMKKDPASVPIAGGSAGSADQIFMAQLATEVGIDPTKVNYVPFAGGGEAVTALLGGQMAAGVSGVSEFAEQVKAGKLRALAVSSNKPVSLLPDAPTITDAGYQTVYENWRSIVAPAGLDDVTRDGYIALMTKMHDTEAWKSVLETKAWGDGFMPAPEFGGWLDTNVKDTTAILTKLGLAAS